MVSVDSHPGKRYFVVDESAGAVPVERYLRIDGNDGLRALIKTECLGHNPRSASESERLERMMVGLGFEWEVLSEPGHLRRKPYAVSMAEAIERRVWDIVSGFCARTGIPLHRVSGGELFNPADPAIATQLGNIATNPMYGTSHYQVTIEGRPLLLRYSACLEKLSLARAAGLRAADLPIGIFEISKSYRYERTAELQLCERVRSFQLPELHVVSQDLDTTLRVMTAAQQTVLDTVATMYPTCEILCGTPHDFFTDHRDSIVALAHSMGRPILVAVYDPGTFCGNGVKLDIEYKVTDSSGMPVEIATLQVDDGTSPFAFGVRSLLPSGQERPVSTLHAVFLGSVERAAYCLMDATIDRKATLGHRPLPVWAAPVQARVIAASDEHTDAARALAAAIDATGARVDVDDRPLPYPERLRDRDLAWLPFIVTVEGLDVARPKCAVEDRHARLTRRDLRPADVVALLAARDDLGIGVPRYGPMRLSTRVIGR